MRGTITMHFPKFSWDYHYTPFRCCFVLFLSFIVRFRPFLSIFVRLGDTKKDNAASRMQKKCTSLFVLFHPFSSFFTPFLSFFVERGINIIFISTTQLNVSYLNKVTTDQLICLFLDFSALLSHLKDHASAYLVLETLSCIYFLFKI